jgi:hypothetical protein
MSEEIKNTLNTLNKTFIKGNKQKKPFINVSKPAPKITIKYEKPSIFARIKKFFLRK